MKITQIKIQTNKQISYQQVSHLSCSYKFCPMSDDQDVGQLKAKLQAQAAQFESYKQQCKHIEQMLEEDCQKKQSQIKQLKEEAIKKEKGEKMLKAQVSQLEAEVANLKMMVSDAPKVDPQAEGQKELLAKLEKENSELKNASNQLENKLSEANAKVTVLQAELNESKAKVQGLKKSLSQAQQKTKSLPAPQVSSSPGKDNKAEQQLKKLKQKMVQMQKDKAKTQKMLKDRQNELQKVKHQSQEKLKKLSHSKAPQQKSLKRQQSEPKEIKQSVPLSEHKHQLSKLNQTIHQLQDRIKELQVCDKQQKVKLTQIMNDKTSLLQKYKKLSHELELQRQRREMGESESSPRKSQEIMIEDGLQQEVKEIPSVRMDSVLLTKKHYISPFIQIKQGKLIKLYKNTKNGFEKSLGATKHKFDSVGHDSEQVVQTAAELARATIDQGQSHSIVVYGSRRTSKKQVFLSILQNLKEWVLQKVDEYQQSQEEQDGLKVQVTYVKHSADGQVHQQKQASSKQQIAQLLQQLSSINGSPSSSPNKKPTNKKNQKPKVRYLLFSFGQSLRLELITTSHLNPFLKQNQTFTDYLNTIIFSKLPNTLQSTKHHYHIITLINPIVSEYEECKNTLSITMVPFVGGHQQNDEPMVSTLVYSPGINLQDLNDLTKKKLESFEKETQQAGIRVRKVEEQCIYFRNRFQELEVRLKNLINTHQQQNTYLKKSPVTLSYEKLLKFVNSVLARNTSIAPVRHSMNNNLVQTYNQEHYQNQVNMYIEEDAKSLDGY